uniref:Aminotransferase-like plant mobile domain-containing protein n=1 Tax=Fagus sylvatica TaxID=28930 RepID=A0A2N9ERE0_FAGSY
MAPGSRGVGAVFVHFSGEDSGQTGDGFGEPRVPRRSWSRYLSNAPGLADQLVASRKDSAREGGSCVAYFCKVPDLRKSELGLVRYGPANRGHRSVFGPFEDSFPIGIPARPGDHLLIEIPARPEELLTIRKLQIVAGVTLLHKDLGSQTKLQRVGENFCANVASQLSLRSSEWSRSGQFDFSFRLGQRSGQTLVKLGQPWSNLVRFGQNPPNSGKCIPGRVLRVFGHSGPQSGQKRLGQPLVKLSQPWSNLVNPSQTSGNVSRTFFLGLFDVANPRRIRPAWFGLSYFACQHPRKSRGAELKLSSCSSEWSKSGQFDSAFGLVNVLVKPWSNLVKLGQNSPNSGKCILGRVSRVFGHSGLQSGQKQSGQTLVKLGQPWSNLAGSVRAVSFYVPTPEKIPWIFSVSVLGYGCRAVHLGLRANPSGVQMGIPGLGEDQTGCEKMVHGLKWQRGACLGTSATLIDDPSSPIRPTGTHAFMFWDAMEDVRTRADASIARNLQAELDAEAAGLVSSAAWPPSRPGVVIGRSARPSGTTRPSPQPSVTTGHSDTPSDAPRRPHTRSTGAPPLRLKRQRAEGIPDSAGAIPEDYVAPGFRYPPQGGIRPRYPVIVEISDMPLLTNLLAHPSSLVRRCQDPPESVGRGGWSEFSRLLAISRREYREFLTELGFGPFLGHPLRIGVPPVNWSAILGIRFGGRAPPSEPIFGPEAREILGLDDHDAIDGTRLPSWAAYFIFSCFLGNDKSTVPTPIVGMFRDVDTLREYDWGALTYGFYIRGLRRFSRRESISFLGFWQFTIFWAFEHFLTFAPSRLPLASDPDFPLARRWDSSRIRRMTSRTLLELRTTVDCIRDADILGGEAAVPVDPSPLMTIEGYIPRAPSDPYVAGVSAYPGLVREDVPYQEWFEQIERLQSEILCLQLELSVCEDRYKADVDRLQGEAAQREGEMTQMRADLAQRQRDLDSRDAELARSAATIRRLEDQLQGVGIPPVTGAGSSGFGQTSSPPPPDPVSRDWFFDDPPSS